MEGILKRELIVDKATCGFIGVLSFVILIALSAFVRIPLPFSPVPITLQTFFVLLSGMFLGSRKGLMAQMVYIVLGIAGVPLFTGTSSGLLYVTGPTGGYLLGFAIAAFFIGRFIRKSDNLFFITGLLILADLIILSSGVLWLRIMFHYPLSTLLFIGFLPFIPGDILKIIAAVAVYKKLKSRINKIFA